MGNDLKTSGTSHDVMTSKWKPSTDTEWGYGRDRGPSNWWVYYPNAAGSHQSPIDIDPEVADFDTDMAMYPLRIKYADDSNKAIKNTGHGVQIDVDGSKSYITGGPLEGKYRLTQFHFHWGDKNDCGSEHTVNQKAYAAELHIVHWNCEKYGTFIEASQAEDGLAVIAVFLECGGHNSYLANITQKLRRVRYKRDVSTMESEFNPSCLLPDDCSKYWVYKGSLTTPPCDESVTWIVFYEPISISHSQLEEFRTLFSYPRGEHSPLLDEFGGRILKNYRPVQPLGTRKISTMEHIFLSSKDIDEQFHRQALFTHTKPELECQYYRQGIPMGRQASYGMAKTKKTNYSTKYK